MANEKPFDIGKAIEHTTARYSGGERMWPVNPTTDAYSTHTRGIRPSVEMGRKVTIGSGPDKGKAFSPSKPTYRGP